jgi:hypothetical protein
MHATASLALLCQHKRRHSKSFAFDSASLVPRCGCQPAKAIGTLFGRRPGDLRFAKQAADQFFLFARSSL